MILQRSTTFYNILQRFNKISQQFYDVSTTFCNITRNINRYILIVAHDVYYNMGLNNDSLNTRGFGHYEL